MHPKAKPFKIVITLGEEKHRGQGVTVFEALKGIAKPVKITTKAFLTISQGDKTSNQVLMPVQTKRLFYPSAQLYLAKQLELLLK